MPPKLLNLGNKAGIIKTVNEPTFELPSNIIEIINKNNILEQKEIQPTINIVEKNEYYERARRQNDKLPMFTIDSVGFSVLNTKTLNKMKIVNVSTNISRTDDITSLIKSSQGLAGKRINKDECYRTEDNRFTAEELPVAQSVTSYSEMGTVDNNKLCTTCYRTNVDCPGHIGEIQLNTAFAHPLFRDYVLKVLSCVCNSCSKVLVTEQYIERQGFKKLHGKNRLNKIFDMIFKSISKFPCLKQKERKCVSNPKYDISKKKSENQFQIKYRFPNGPKEYLTKDMKNVIQILNNISDEDAKLLGFENGSHPRDMIMEALAVIPPCARPYIIREGIVKEDHLTNAYDEIIRDNFKYNTVNDENRKHNIESDLYFHISHMIDNSDNKYCRSPTEKILGIKQRITKKEGLIRYNIMGKRVNFCGRSVLGPDSTLKFGEVAIPAAMAEKLTVPEMVHEKNLDYIRDLWNKRQITHFQFTESGERFRADKNYERIIDGKVLEPYIGFVVERFIRDGDVVLVNRQPTLYKYSMIGNFIKIVPRKTIGLHMTETKMRQADFDGDEANIHVIQGIDARVETATFANVQANIPEALKNNAMIGMMQNSVSSAFMMTRDTVKNIDEYKKKYKNGEINKLELEMLQEVHVNQELMDEAKEQLTYREDLESLPARLKKHGVDPLSGRAMFSMLLPKDFQYEKKGKIDNNYVVIKDGVLIKGVIENAHIGKAGTAIHLSIWKWYGRERSVAFVTDCTFLTDWYIYQHGLSLGFSDVMVSKSIAKEIDNLIIKSLNEVKLNINALPKITPGSSPIEKTYNENKIKSFLNDFKKSVDKIGDSALLPCNPLNIMSNSGAKGSSSNTSNIVGIKGQENVFGERPTPKLNDGARSLPYFEFNSDDIKARGFISNSFMKGLTPSEMYFLSESSRVGLINTATTTAESGALSHKLVKVLEDCKIAYDGSVRNASNAIYQLAYLDGYDVGELTNTNSKSTGEVVSFINIKEAVKYVNSEFA